MKDYEIEWEALHRITVRANSGAEAIEMVEDLAEIEASFVKMIIEPEIL